MGRPRTLLESHHQIMNRPDRKRPRKCKYPAPQISYEQYIGNRVRISEELKKKEAAMKAAGEVAS